MKPGYALWLVLCVACGGTPARASTIASYSDQASFGARAEFFPGTFLVANDISACDPELCSALTPVLSANVSPAAPNDAFVVDAADNPNWTQIVSLLDNDNTFYTLCLGFTMCNSVFTNTVGALFFPNGGSFSGDSVRSIEVSLTDVAFDSSGGFDSVSYTETVSVLDPDPAAPEPLSAWLIVAGGALFWLLGRRLREGLAAATASSDTPANPPFGRR
jgi:hypothetical protein